MSDLEFRARMLQQIGDVFEECEKVRHRLFPAADASDLKPQPNLGSLLNDKPDEELVQICSGLKAILGHLREVEKQPSRCIGF